MLPSYSTFSMPIPMHHYSMPSPYGSNPQPFHNPFLPYFRPPVIDVESLLKFKQGYENHLLSLKLASLPKTEVSTPSLSTGFSKAQLLSPIETPSPQASISETKP